VNNLRLSTKSYLAAIASAIVVVLSDPTSAGLISAFVTQIVAKHPRVSFLSVALAVAFSLIHNPKSAKVPNASSPPPQK
jgi:hypothetical protein